MNSSIKDWFGARKGKSVRLALWHVPEPHFVDLEEPFTIVRSHDQHVDLEDENGVISVAYTALAYWFEFSEEEPQK